jgi:plastocyanin
MAWRYTSSTKVRLAAGAGIAGAAAAALLFMLPDAGKQALAQSTAQRWEVQVSATDPSNTLIVQGFAPNPLTIHVGDTVTWKWANNPAPHTVTFNSGKPSPPDFLPGPNPGELMLGPAGFPIGPTGPTISYDGTMQLNSGIPAEADASYSITFTKAGTFGYVCVLHPGMRGEVEVREANLPLPETPAQAAARGRDTVASLLARMQADAAGVQSASMNGVHTAMAGLGDGFGASYIQFLPQDISVKRGDTVVWVMPDPYEVHTISFTSGATPPDFIEPRPQPNGPPMLIIPATVASPVGGSTYTGQGPVNSGIVGNGNAFFLKIDAPPGSYDYLCLIHPTMKAKVTVTG